MTSGAARAERGKDEVEVKLPCDDLDAVREKLRALDAKPVSPLHLEINDLYDDREGKLVGSGSTLRLRRARGEAILTYKGPARFADGVKTREERQTRVSDAAETEAILHGLGLTRKFRYEKHREEWRLDRCLVALDETPIGRFVEIEGDPPQIRRAVVSLALDFASAIPYSYARLYRERRRENPELPEDMVFDRREAEGGPAGG